MKKNDLKLRKVLIDTFPNSKIPKSINELKMGDLKDWDSMGNFNLILSIEQNFSVKFNMDQVEQIKSIKEIKKILKKSNVKD
tara:strand:- start:716 stop:961 length:246 start_codon:yes stop_codon:yes gene_type:complete